MQVTVAEVYDTFALGNDIKRLFVIELLYDQAIWLDKHGLHFFDNGLDDSFFSLLLSERWIRILYAVLLCYTHDSRVYLCVILHDIIEHFDANSLF